MKKFVGMALAAGLAILIAGSAQAITNSRSAQPRGKVSHIFAHNVGIQRVRVGGWSYGYKRIYLIVDVKSGGYKEPSTARVTVHCASGLRRSGKWFDGDGSSVRYVRIPSPWHQGKCVERLHARTDDGVRIYAGLGV